MMPPPSDNGRSFGVCYSAVFLGTLAGGLMAYKTIGEVAMLLYCTVILLLQVPLLLTARVSRPWAMLGAVALFVAVIPYQVYLGIRFLRVHGEAKRIVQFAYDAHRATGRFPASLDHYEFRDREIRRYIQDYDVLERTGDFTLTYRVGTVNTSHWYSSRTGWGYHAD